MTKDEMIEKIMSKSGITREQAEEALEKNNNDLIDAMIYVERTYMTARNMYGSSGYEGYSNNPGQDFRNFNCSKTAAQEDSEFKNTVLSILETLWKNKITVSYKNEEVMSMPLLIWIVLFMISASTLLLVMIISLFFDVRYYIKGVTLDAKKANSFMDSVYNAVNMIKKSFIS